MRSFTVTITRDDDQAATTVLRLDLGDDNEARLTDLHLHSDTGLMPHTMPAIDYVALLHAITPNPASAPTDPGTATLPRSGPRRRGDSIETSAKGRRKVTTSGTSANPRTTVSTSAAADRAPEGQRRATGRGRAPGNRQESAASAAPLSRKTQKQTPAPAKARPYRRMPEDFLTTYQSTGSSARAAAEHYQVPAHTVHAWLHRLRRNDAL